MLGHVHTYYFFIDEDIVIDRNEFKNEIFQCVFQYLRWFDSEESLSSFLYRGPSVEGNYSACIRAIQKYVSPFDNIMYITCLLIFYTCSHCPIKHPTWAELAQFVRFLYVQLNDCQKSIYCNQEFFGKGTDFKTFVVKFMIRMSQVCVL